MIIVVSSEGNSKYSEIDLRFGRCKYFAVYDSESKEFIFKENDAIQTGHGAGIAAGQTVSSLNADVVLTGNLGPKALNVLEANGIKGYKLNQVTLEEAINLFQKDELCLITEASKIQKR